MANERLRSTIAAAGLTLADAAAKVGVDPKTIERWITTERLPHRSHRWATAALLESDEAYLWPDVVDDTRSKKASEAEFVALYPNRGAVPYDLWRTLIDGATEAIDVLVFAGLFLPDGYPDLGQKLAEKGAAGTRIRLLLGNPDSPAVRLRGEEEGIGEGMATRVRLSLSYLAAAFTAPGVEARLHETTLYASIYRFDDDLLANTHVFGAPAAQSPVVHYKRVHGGRLFDHYVSSIDRVWDTAHDARSTRQEASHGAR